MIYQPYFPPAAGFCLILASVMASAATAEPEPLGMGLSSEESKSGYQLRRPVFGGPTSPEGEIEETNRLMNPAFRFPKIDQTFKPWNDWKNALNEEHGLQFSAHYSTMFQRLDESLGDEDKASGGVLRGTGKWTLLGRDTPDTGALILTIDHRHAFRDIAPADLAPEAGYIGVTSLFYGDTDWSIINLNWQQGFNDGRTGLVAGRYDPNDYMNVLGYVNPWSIFTNLASNLDTSVALPDSSWGIGAGHWLNDQWYVLGGVNDANGLGTDSLEFFEGGAEFFTYAHIGWSPSKDQRYFKNVHILGWHVDEREDAGLEESQGVSFAANWTFDDRYMPFVRLGFSSGSAPISNESASLGIIRKFIYRSDLIGLSAAWGKPPDAALREQTTIETFWRFQFAQNLAISPNVQLLLNPSLNPSQDKVWVLGLRTRLTF